MPISVTPASSGSGSLKPSSCNVSGGTYFCHCVCMLKFRARPAVRARPCVPQSHNSPSPERAMPVNGPTCIFAAMQRSVSKGCSGSSAENSDIFSGNKSRTHPCRTGTIRDTPELVAIECDSHVPFFLSSSSFGASAQSCPPGLSQICPINPVGAGKLLIEYPSSSDTSGGLELVAMSLPCGVNETELYSAPARPLAVL